MLTAVYGGSFNPPHIGHISAARAAAEQLGPGKLLIMPSNIPPHKALDTDSPDAMERLLLAELAFAELGLADISDIEMRREGPSYTADTVAALLEENQEICLLMGTDMLLTFGSWYRSGWLLENVSLAVFARRGGDYDTLVQAAEQLRSQYGARITLIEQEPIDISSTELRRALKERAGREFLPDKVYERIIQKRSYGAKPELVWLRDIACGMLSPGRVAHVLGTEKEAVKLAARWGIDAGEAAEAAILHDITKNLSYEEQLLLCEKYGIITDVADMPKLLHPVTGAALARDLFGVDDAVYGAIRWHTTGRVNMTGLEKIIYLADYIEPEREDFDGLAELRSLAYEDMDAALMLGLELTLEDLSRQGLPVHPSLTEVLKALKRERN